MAALNDGLACVFGKLTSGLEDELEVLHILMLLSHGLVASSCLQKRRALSWASHNFLWEMGRHFVKVQKPFSSVFSWDTIQDLQSY